MRTERPPSPTMTVVWPWRAAGTRATRPAWTWRRVVLGTLVGLAVASLLAWAGHPVAAAVVGGIALALAACAALAPRAYGAIHAGLARFGTFVGTALAWILLVPFFYAVFPIGRLGFRLRGRDPLEREFPTDRPSYWEPREPYEDAEAHCRRQFS